MKSNRPPGRPRVDDEEESVQVGVTLPKTQYDRYAQRAIARDVSVPEIIRRELQKKSKK